MDRDHQIAALIASAHARADEALRRYQSHDRVDRTVPVASEWLRRWGPKRIRVTAPDCACAQGRCAVCN
jgi:hypothetical protein